MKRNIVPKLIFGLSGFAFLNSQVLPANASGLNATDVPLTETINEGISSRMTYGRFLEYLEVGWVKQVDLYDNNRKAIVSASSPELGNRSQSISVQIPVGASQLIQKLKEYNVNFDAHPASQKNAAITLLSNLLLPILFIGGLLFFFLDFEDLSNNSFPSPMNFGKSPARFDQKPETGILFRDIAGIDEAKAEFEEIVSFLREPERYTIVGARIPKGVLLIGPPGTGKTLLARAIANEAKVPFYSVAGSEFVEMFIGVGAARIRDLFKKAGENTPCIVFIDEIDAVGRERGAGIGGGNDEREQTLNQLLTEMDGFKENKGVIVVGATNRVDILDSALLRPGRFDRQITVGLPDRLGRIGILKVHAKNKPFAEDVSLVSIANRTPNFSGADLANLLNESAILATRYKKKIITQNEIDEAIDRIICGIAGTRMDDSKYKRLIAYHEVGHAFLGSVLKHHDEVDKITLIPRGNAKGLTWFTPKEDQTLITRSQLMARIITILGGHASEEIVFGKADLTNGPSNDLQRATNIARQMVTRYGMSKIGPIALEDNNNEQIFSGNDGDQALKNRIDAEVFEIMKHCQRVAQKMILDNRVILDLAIFKLLEFDQLSGREFRKILNQYLVLPEKP